MLALSVVMYAVSAAHLALLVVAINVTEGCDNFTDSFRIISVTLFLPVINVRPCLVQGCQLS